MSGTTPTPASVMQALNEMTAEIESAISARGLVACVEGLCGKMSSFAQYRAIPSLTPILIADNLIWTLIRAYKTALRDGQTTSLEQHLQQVAQTYLQSHSLPPKTKEPAKPVLPESPEVIVGGVDLKGTHAAKPPKKKANAQDAMPNTTPGVVDVSKQVRVLRGPMDSERVDGDVKADSKPKKTEGKGKKAKKVEGKEASSSKADPASEGTIVVDTKKKGPRTRAQPPASRPTNSPATAPPPMKRPLADTEGGEEIPAKRQKADRPAPTVPTAPIAPSAPRTAKGKVESQRPAILVSSSTRLEPAATNDDDEEYVVSMDEESQDEQEGGSVKRRRASTSTQQSGQVLQINLASNRKCERCTAVTGSPCILRFNIPVKPVKVVGDRVKLTCQDCRDKKQKCEWATVPPLPSDVPIVRYDPIKKAEVKGKGKGKEKEKEKDVNAREHKGKGKGKRKESNKVDTSDDSVEDSDVPPPRPRTAVSSNEHVLLQTIQKLEDEVQATKKWVEEGPMKRITSMEKSLEELKVEWQRLHNQGVAKSAEWAGKFSTFKKQYETEQKKVADKDTVDTLQTHFKVHGQVIAQLRTRIEQVEDAQKRLEAGIKHVTRKRTPSPRPDSSARPAVAVIAEDNTQESATEDGNDSDVASGTGVRGGRGALNVEDKDAHDTSEDESDCSNSEDEDEGEANSIVSDVEHEGEADAEDGDMDNKVLEGDKVGMDGADGENGGNGGIDTAKDDVDGDDGAKCQNGGINAGKDELDGDGDVNMNNDTTGVSQENAQVKHPETPTKASITPTQQLVGYSDAEDMDVESPSPNVPAESIASVTPLAPSTPSRPPPSTPPPLKVDPAAIMPSSLSPSRKHVPVTTSPSHRNNEEALEW